MITQYFSALFFIFLAEMGDKTQILAMMFATRYKIRTVLVGVMIGSFLNHGIAVLIGTLLGKVIDVSLLQFVAGLAFIGFSIWTLKEEEEEDEETTTTSKSGIVTVALAFFLGELGDKTQLTAITLAVDSAFPVLVLLGTVSGMVLTSSIGIFVGAKVGDRIPEILIKMISGSIFLLFGSIKIFQSAPDFLRNGVGILILSGVIAFVLYRVYRLFIHGAKSGQLSPYRKAAQELYVYTNSARELTKELCLTETVCGKCKGEKCGVGLIKHILSDLERWEQNAKKGEIIEKEHSHEELIRELIRKEKGFELEKLEELKRITDHYLNDSTGPESRTKKEVSLIEEVIDKLIAESKKG